MTSLSNTQTDASSKILLLLHLLYKLTAIEAMGWSLSSYSCNSSSGSSSTTFTNTQITLQCNGSSTCTFGDRALVSGTTTALYDFENDEVTLQPCLMGWCPEEYAAGAGHVCDWIQPADDDDDGGISCGDAGEYVIYYEQDIPTKEEVSSSNSYVSNLSWLSSLITVKLVIGEDGHDGCSGSSSGYDSMRYSILGMGSVIVGLVAYGERERRRRKQQKKSRTKKGRRGVRFSRRGGEEDSKSIPLVVLGDSSNTMVSKNYIKPVGMVFV
mmetsp:Transcript_12112/g.23613  ORF Transcript_12112/g.23613 Transcript_12112/m.23613 type:complete len:269 (-) Transcript_12112:178-984(-)|eukprot:CAMPEP_0171351584 /NCGR_PEP_ID=MMETSP0878-20121228/39482_1 /TAXON_ID=67004 /ORGANISM="Thalassiosira weissflogii, Strain CCMP1336" /LENGTH=268 /DNA_ID=CAMNT_0011856939 /DNA_START=67 /DNA_END=873 /DNA_ORIENTATION=+